MKYSQEKHKIRELWSVNKANKQNLDKVKNEIEETPLSNNNVKKIKTVYESDWYQDGITVGEASTGQFWISSNLHERP